MWNSTASNRWFWAGCRVREHFCVTALSSSTCSSCNRWRWCNSCGQFFFLSWHPYSSCHTESILLRGCKIGGTLETTQGGTTHLHCKTRLCGFRCIREPFRHLCKCHCFFTNAEVHKIQCALLNFHQCYRSVSNTAVTSVSVSAASDNRNGNKLGKGPSLCMVMSRDWNEQITSKIGVSTLRFSITTNKSQLPTAGSN